jgi:hypothetical protein
LFAGVGIREADAEDGLVVRDAGGADGGDVDVVVAKFGGGCGGLEGVAEDDGDDLSFGCADVEAEAGKFAS